MPWAGSFYSHGGVIYFWTFACESGRMNFYSGPAGNPREFYSPTVAYDSGTQVYTLRNADPNYGALGGTITLSP
jgi:hypothetical protein